ncbi:hypothetical protein [Shewanella psychropiezotolerans]|nr:hypothetical protein [Shewanella psychropiezotolerans]
MNNKKSDQTKKSMWHRENLETKGIKIALNIMDKIQKAKQVKLT